LREIYFDIPFKTEQQRQLSIDQNLSKMHRNARATKFIVLFWFVVVPACTALFEYFGPAWLGLVVLIYALWKSFQEWRKFTGRKVQSEREKLEAEKKSKSDHYFYHCERNSEGFLRLKLENFERDAREKTRREAAEIAE
jgi:hypothetical protein